VYDRTPYEAWMDNKPKVSHLRVFGCIAYALVHSQLRHKLDEKSEKYTFVGYSAQSKAYKLYSPISGKVLISRNVIFDETASWSWGEEHVKQGTLVEDPAFVKLDSAPASAGNSPLGSSVSSATNFPTRSSACPPTGSAPSTPTGSIANSSNNVSSSSDEQPSDVQIPLRRSTRDRKPNPKYAANIYNSCSFAMYVTEPTSYEGAAEVPEWREAMIEEMRAIEHNQRWELVDLPEDKSPIGLKWVFRLKYHADESIQKYKARLVTKGSAQHQGIDFDETFSPVARFKVANLSI